jgi:predicted urease superfamily metal-dependent hydrolase
VVDKFEKVVKFVNAEIEYLEKYWEGYNPEAASIPHPHFEYDQGKLRAYREMFAELKRIHD